MAKDNTKDTKDMMKDTKDTKAGIYFVPPSWIIVGIEDPDNSTAEELVLSEAAYVESVGADSVWAIAHSEKAVGRAWPMAPGCRIRREAILIQSPADPKVIRRVTRASDRSALEGAK